MGALSVEQKEELALRLVSVLKKIRALNPKLSLHLEQNLHDVLVDDTTTLSAVLGGPLYKDQWRYIRLIAQKIPFSLSLEEWLETIVESEVKDTFSSNPNVALTWAEALEMAIVSWNHREPWLDNEISVLKETLLEDGTLTSARTTVRNFSSEAHVEEQERWLTWDSQKTDTANELWSNRSLLFPNLRFLSEVSVQILGVEASPSAFVQLRITLKALQEDAARWQISSAAMPRFSTKVTPEHEGRKRLFNISDGGIERNFHMHARFTGGIAGRVHFYICNDNKEIVVGYIGKKL